MDIYIESSMVSSIFVTIGLLVNFISSTSIVGVNKYIYTHFGFPNVTLTCIHFVITFIGLVLCQLLGVFKIKKLPIIDMLQLAVTFSGFVVLTNLSLQYNTVGTYQLMKTLTMPLIMIIETYFYGKSFSWSIRLTFIPIFAGVIANSYYDVKFSSLGIAIASIGVIAASLYQILVSSKQNYLSANSMQLLIYQAPISAVLLCFVIPLLEPVVGPGGILSANWSHSAIGTVVMSGVIAFSVNISIYWVIGKTSALTYNMFGHLKFCAALLLGYVVFHDPISLNQFIGMLITIFGVVTYSLLKLKETKKTQALPK